MVVLVRLLCGSSYLVMHSAGLPMALLRNGHGDHFDTYETSALVFFRRTKRIKRGQGGGGKGCNSLDHATNIYS